MEANYEGWLQTDAHLNREEAWPARLFPEADCRYFRDCGCLVCSLAVLLRHGGLETADESRFDPWILNRRLIDCGAFTPAADLELSQIRKLYPLRYAASLPYSREGLERAAADGSLCLITVPGIRAERHFTALLQLTPDDALVFDPLCGEKRLRQYERLCEIRVFRRLP